MYIHDFAYTLFPSHSSFYSIVWYILDKVRDMMGFDLINENKS